MVDDGFHLVLSVENTGLALELATNTLANLPLTGPQTFGRLGFVDGRILTHEPGTRQFWWSEPFAATTWLGTSTASAEGKPDPIVTLLTDHREVYLLGTQSTEIWHSTGDVAFPFVRNNAAFIEQGGEARWAVAAANNTLFWLGGSARGEGPVWMLNGYTPERISTAAIETAMSRMATVGDCIAFPISFSGHSWMLWHFPTGNATWLYDTNTQSWCELADLGDDGALDAYRCATHAYSAGEHVLGDRETGQLYLLDEHYYQYGTRPIYRERISPHIRNDQQPVSYGLFELVMQCGVGLDGLTLPGPLEQQGFATGELGAQPPGADPQIRLSYSDDGGLTYSYPLARSFGRRGAYAQRVTWRRIGRSASQRCFKVVVTDPVPVSLLGARVEVG
jgi:hypothetical protein